MSDHILSEIRPDDRRANEELEKLLNEEGIRKDANLDYTCGIYDDEYRLIATGSCFDNTLRCIAVSRRHQGEGLMNEIVTHLIQYQAQRGNTHLFLYTKCSAAGFFEDLGFYEIVRIEGKIVFMENRRGGFSDYLHRLVSETASSVTGSCPRRTAAVVMNANPFTLGHRYLLERACAENDLVHLFIVSEDVSLIPFSVRKKLILEGTKDLGNIVYHESGPYIISHATFPSYFQKDDKAVIESHALLDITVFAKIADALHIGRRYVGEEPYSTVTGIYNKIMQKELPENGIDCVVVPRKKIGDRIISASTVRQAIKDNRPELLKAMVPDTTYQYFLSEEAKPVIGRIQKEADVIHY